MQDYEKLGAFYLGRVKPLGEPTGSEPYLIESRELVTHGVIMGMTGSGKTGLGISLLEEAAIDGVPGLVVDPKGDLANLLLTFPNMQAQDFEPWVAPDEAQRQGITTPQLAEKTANLWRDGLAKWDETPERINLLRKACDITVYTPGSLAGVPISVLSSFAPPTAQVLQDPELLGGHIQSTVSGLLGLLGITADPLKSREHLLISALFQKSWLEGAQLTLADLISQVQKPPINKVGVLDLESFYPAQDRFALAMSINSLIASPSFQGWMQGAPLDIGKLLFTPSGKPRLAVFSIAHLTDSERMFFVTLLADAAINWMRSMSGTTSLRALFYMDEVFGYLPPVAQPPSKKPLLTLLKQARAFGLGLILATQNPSDLDYKALSNAGSWFIGRLQTERDRAKVKDGLLEVLGTKADAKALEGALSGLDKRIFLALTPGAAPTFFETRWTLSYLRGPMTREDIKKAQPKESQEIASDNSGEPSQSVTGIRPCAATPEAQSAVFPGLGAVSFAAPVLPPDIPQCWLPSTQGAAAYRPVLLGVSQIHVSDKKLNVNCDREFIALAPVTDGPVQVDWQTSIIIGSTADCLSSQPEEGLHFGELPHGLTDNKKHKQWSKEYVNWLYHTQSLQVMYSPDFKMTAKVGETEQQFRARLSMAARESRDERVDAIKQKYATKIEKAQAKIQKAQAAVEKENDDVSRTKVSSLLSIGSSIFGFLTSRKKLSATNLSKARTVYNQFGRNKTQSEQLTEAENKLEEAQAQAEELQQNLQDEINNLQSMADVSAVPLATEVVSPKKSDITVRFFGVGWAPVDANGNPSWRQ